jgi:C1A family cysteine protease
MFLDEWLGPVRDQGSEGSCTGNAAAGDNDFQLRLYDPRFKGNPAAAPVTSVQFIYRMARKLDGTTGDAGSTGRTTCKVLLKYGACTEASWPYKAGDIYRDPTPAQLAEALKFKSGAYHFAYTVDDIKSVIASKYCMRLGFAVFESFEEDTGRTTVYAPKKGESLLGGHEVLIKGYSDSQFGGAFSVRNSWGKSWGVRGDFWLPYEVAADSKVFMDAVIQHFGKPWVPKPLLQRSAGGPVE